MSVDVLGDEPADLRTFIQIPEQFERDRHKESLAPTIFRIGQIFLALGLLCSVLIFFSNIFVIRRPAPFPGGDCSHGVFWGCLAFL